MSVVTAILLGLLGAGLLWLVYYALRSAWPLAYVSLSETYSLSLGSTLWRLLLFRLAPTFLAALALVVTCWRVEAVDWIAVTVAVGIHLGSTNVRAVIAYFLRSDSTQQVNYSGYHIWSSGILIASAIAAALLAPLLERFVPSPESLVENLWIAGFVAVVGAALFRVSTIRDAKQGHFGTIYFTERAGNDVGIEVLDHLFAASERTGADPLLLKSILVCEVLQRPKWMRRLEWFKAEMLLPGTYGAMQVRAAEPVSDTESVDRVATQMAGRWGTKLESVDDGMGGLQSYFINDDKAIWSAAGAHNGEKSFIDSAIEIYSHLFNLTSSAEFHGPGRSLRIVEVRRYASEFGIRAVTNAERVELRFGLGNNVAVTTPFPAGALRSVELRIDGRESHAWLLLDRLTITRLDLSQIIPMGDRTDHPSGPR